MRTQKYFIAKDQSHFLTENECMYHESLLLAKSHNQQYQHYNQPIKMHTLFTDNRLLEVNVNILKGRMIEVKNLSTESWTPRKFSHISQDNAGFVFVCLDGPYLENWRFAREITCNDRRKYNNECNCLNYGETYQYF